MLRRLWPADADLLPRLLRGVEQSNESDPEAEELVEEAGQDEDKEEVRTAQHPEGPIQWAGRQVLTRASCGHLAYRSLEGVAVPLFMVEESWASIPCLECEPFYVISILDRAKAILDDAWVRGYYARDRYTSAIHALDPRAVAWSMVGACWRARSDCHHVSPRDVTTDYVLWKTFGVVAAAVSSETCPHNAMEHNIAIICVWEQQPRREKKEVLDALTSAKGEVLTAIAQREESRRAAIEPPEERSKEQQVGGDGSPDDDPSRRFRALLASFGCGEGE